MANPTDVLMQLQAKLDTKYMIKNTEITDDLEEDLEEDIGNQTTASTGSGFGSSLANKRYNPSDKDLDVADAEEVDEPYVTNRGITLPNRDDVKNVASKSRLSVEDLRVSLEQAVSPEASEKGMSTSDPGPDAPGHTGTEAPPEGGEMPADPGMGGEMPGGEMGGGMGMEQEDPYAAKNSSELGRIYELKKIYTRLTTIESYLSESSEPELSRMRLLVSKSIELFEILASNIPIYKAPKAPKERLDEIIIMYYKFLKQVYESVAKYYKGQANASGADGLKKTNISISSEEIV